MHFQLHLAAILALVVATAASPTTPEPEIATTFLSEAEMIHWLQTTDAELTFIGEPIPGVNVPALDDADLARRAALSTTVVYCNRRVNGVCGGACTTYNGGAKCLNAPDTQCLHATHNVGFCAGKGCGGGCNQFSSCGTKLDGGFCYTPGTNSIVVGPY
ncbi:hypothetical protein BD626DRAFT_549727 [Schizophyllum amplum]|uniref:Uncharacterized protein n=1 Tax=Schizophyllum amplum TaxID=97359 RepID=A0A550C6J1_9AGAR|nr:hypothetical protein BD626DRAFT_549727 [Auriculariopsis ampla]